MSMTTAKWGDREDEFSMKTRWIYALATVQGTKIHFKSRVHLMEGRLGSWCCLMRFGIREF